MQKNGKLPEDLLIHLEVISAQAQTGLGFTKDTYDANRYKEILKTLDKIGTLLEQQGKVDASALYFVHNPLFVLGNQEYITPKVAVATVVFNKSNEVLLVKRTEDLWTLPGGYADISFDPIENALKEVREETGFDITINSLIGIYDSNISEFPTVGRHTYTLVFYGTICGGELRPDPVETLGASFFPLDDLPNLPEASHAQIERGQLFFTGQAPQVFIDHKD